MLRVTVELITDSPKTLVTYEIRKVAHQPSSSKVRSFVVARTGHEAVVRPDAEPLMFFVAPETPVDELVETAIRITSNEQGAATSVYLSPELER